MSAGAHQFETTIGQGIRIRWSDQMSCSWLACAVGRGPVVVT